MRQSCTMLRVPPYIFHVSAQPRRDEPGAGEADCRGEIHEATIVQKDVSAFCQLTICGRHVSQGFFWTSVVCCARYAQCQCKSVLCSLQTLVPTWWFVCVCAPLPLPSYWAHPNGQFPTWRPPPPRATLVPLFKEPTREVTSAVCHIGDY